MNTVRLYVLVCVFSLLSLISFNTFAASNDVATAESRVVSVSNQILSQLESNRERLQNDPAALSALVRNQILPFIDFDAMAKLTLGKFWGTASASQRTRFINAYRDMLVRNYANRMLDYAGATMHPKNATSSRPGYVTVRTIVQQKNGAPIEADYEVRNKSGEWKAYNIVISGINLITNYRTNFTREISQTGLDALITRLEKSGK